MENLEETVRLEVKTDPETVRDQARWCGIKPGQRVLDAGCGPGKISSIIYDMVQPGGSITGLDYSEERVIHGKDHYGREPGIDFKLHDLRDPLPDIGLFDIIWVRFVLEYNREESLQIVRNLTEHLKHSGRLCLMDLDHNCLSHYELPFQMEKTLFQIMEKLETAYNFDPYSGRKLYAYLYDLGYRNIQVDLKAHHLLYGKTRDEDLFNWFKKVEVIATKIQDIFEEYPGGQDAFFEDFTAFFSDSRRFTYTPLILCKGIKPLIP